MPMCDRAISPPRATWAIASDTTGQLDWKEKSSLLLTLTGSTCSARIETPQPLTRLDPISWLASDKSTARA